MFIEDIIEDQKIIWGEYLPKNNARSLRDPNRSCVKVKGVGCVFVGSVIQCQQYIAANEHKYEKKNSRRLLER